MSLWVEFKYIKRSEKPTKEKIATLVQKATTQLNEYEKDEIVLNYINDGLKVQRVVIVFWGWEMVWCEAG